MDIAVLRGLRETVASFDAGEEKASHFATGMVDTDISEILLRYLKLSKHPKDARHLDPLLLKELHYRLLMAPGGAMSHHLIWHNSQASKIYRAINNIRANFNQSLTVPQIAKLAGGRFSN